MEKKSRLGRGLDALLSGAEGDPPVANGASQVSVDVIEQSPFQPRKGFDDDELSALSASIKTHGILQPLVVRQVGGRFQLVAGERRLRAARAAGLSSVPVTVVNFNDQEASEAALIENIQRSDLNPIEKAHGFKDYLDRYHMTHEQLAGRLGLARPTITNLVALLELPGELQDSVRVGQLTTGHAKVLKGCIVVPIPLLGESIFLGHPIHQSGSKETLLSGRTEGSRISVVRLLPLLAVVCGYPLVPCADGTLCEIPARLHRKMGECPHGARPSRDHPSATSVAAREQSRLRRTDAGCVRAALPVSRPSACV